MSRSRPPSSLAMRLISIVAVMVAALALGISVDTAWARRSLLDTQAYIDNIAAPMLANPAVKDALASELATQGLSEVDLGTAFAQLVPSGYENEARSWGDQIVADWKAQLKPAIHAQLDSPEFSALWDQANRAMHRQLVDALERPTTGATVTLDLRAVLVSAVHNFGVEAQRSLGDLPFVTDIFDGIGKALPADVGKLPIDVSDIGAPSRFMIVHADAIFFVSAGIGVLALALGLAVARRRGLTLIVFGAAIALTALVSYLMVATSSVGAGDKFAARAITPTSAEMRQLVDIQAALVVNTFRSWAGGLGVTGVAIALIGIVWHGNGRRVTRRSADGLVPAAAWPEPEKSVAWKLPEEPPTR